MGSNYGQKDFYMVLELLKLFNNVHYMLSLDDHGPSTQVMLLGKKTIVINW